MTNSQRLAAVRRCLDRWIEEQQSDGDIEIRDSILIRDGFFVGRRFQLGRYHAVWFMEEDEVKVHDQSGSLVARLDSFDINRSSQNASSSPVAGAIDATPEHLGHAITIPMNRPHAGEARRAA